MGVAIIQRREGEGRREGGEKERKRDSDTIISPVYRLKLHGALDHKGSL